MGGTGRQLRPDASDRGFAIGLYLEHLEEASFLYEQRLALLDDREVGWPDLADFEERLEAHLDALTVGGELALAVCRQQALQGDVGEYHATISVFCRHQRFDLLQAALDPLDPADEERIRAAGDALARDMPSEWCRDVSHLLSAGHAGLRRIAARVIGFRRLSAAPELLASVGRGGSYTLPEVAWALGRLRAGDATSLLRRMFDDEQNGATKRAAALALLQVGHRGIVRACLEQARRHPALLFAVGLGGGWDDLHALLEFEAGPNRLLAMGLLGEVSAIGPLMAGLESEATAEAAAFALNLITGAGLYERAVVPELFEEDELFDEERAGEQVEGRWDFMYLFEVMDRCGNGKIYPDFEVETPYIVVPLDR